MLKILFGLIILLFIFLRFYQIDKSLFFFNDMGRDLLVLQEWQEKGKPPLLGPQTSALPINQSPIYFYYLYPFYLLTQGSPYTSLIANAFLYISFFIFAFFQFKKQRLNLLIIFFLISIHPQYIIQSRYVWNPSLVTPFIILAIFYLLNHRPTKSGLLLAIAISLSYSVAPLLVGFIITYLLLYKSQFFKYILGLITGLLISNLPLLFFEIKYHFQLTRSLLTRGVEPQIALDFWQKTTNLGNYLFSTNNSLLFTIITISLVAISLFIFIKISNIALKSISLLIFITLSISLISPITIQAHYIFALTTLLFTFISFLPVTLFTPLILFSILLFLKPGILKSYFQPSNRTFSQMESCFKQFCSTFKSPIYISVNSLYHPYHNGPEHQYIAKKAGCSVVKFENPTKPSNTMIVVGDGQTFEPQKTQYYELSQFGPYQLTRTFNCLSNFNLYQITKK